MSFVTSMSTSLNRVGEGAIKVASTLKGFAIWLGRAISVGFTGFIIPAVVTIWNSFLRTGFGVAAMAGLAGWMLFEMSTSDRLAGSEHSLARRIVMLSGALFLVLAGAALTLGEVVLL